MIKYTFGNCNVCRKYTALKDGRCADCNKKFNIDDILKLFKG